MSMNAREIAERKLAQQKLAQAETLRQTAAALVDFARAHVFVDATNAIESALLSYGDARIEEAMRALCSLCATGEPFEHGRHVVKLAASVSGNTATYPCHAVPLRALRSTPSPPAPVSEI